MKIGSLVKISKEGRKFYFNKDKLFEVFSCHNLVNYPSFIKAIRHFVACHGIGKVMKLMHDDFNAPGESTYKVKFINHIGNRKYKAILLVEAKDLELL